MQHWTPSQLATQLSQQADAVYLLDVREPWEYEIAHLSNSLLIPLGQLPLNSQHIPNDKPIVIICHHGIRSTHACYLLERAGFDTINLTGGIDRWAREIDHSMPIY